MRKGRREFDKRSSKHAPKNITRSTPHKHTQRNSHAGIGLPRGERHIAGIHAVAEALKIRAHKISELWLREDWESRADVREVVEKGRGFKGQIRALPETTLDRICKSHQGMIASVAENPQWSIEDLDDETPATILVLDQITDSHNLGAILRSSWLMGVSAIYVPELRANHLSPSAAKVACGGAEHVPVIVESHFQGLIDQLKEKQFWVYGLAGEGKDTLWKLDLPERVVWMVGAEDKGLRKSMASLCDTLVRIPQADAQASYNASVATAIALAETVRQKR